MMKLVYSIFLCVAFSLGLSAQTSKESKVKLIERERLAAKKMAKSSVNPNTLNYDLIYVRVELDLDPTQQYVSGTVTSHFKMLEDSPHIYFDLAKNLTVSEVKYHNQNLIFEQLSSDELKISFPSTITAQTLDSLSITYQGVPDATADAFSAGLTPAGEPVLATLSEPFGAREWWPTKQSMNDKIEKMDIKITTPEQYSVASNGVLKSVTNLGNGKKLTYWQTNYPIAAYLFALGISNYTVINSTITTSHHSFPFVNYLYPATAANPSNIDKLNWTATCMQSFEDYFGLYPFSNEKYGHLQFNWGGGMEHQTISSMIYFENQLVAHELAHQWFGDKVTCGSWNDIWLNEGFATFGEHLAYEKILMTPSQFQQYLDSEITYITSQPGGSVYIHDSDPGFYRIFDGRLSYAKGGYVLRMMKWVMGDEAFYNMLKAYHSHADFAFGYVKTADFLSFVNQYSGINFNEFFNDWVYGEGFPAYQVRWKQNIDNQDLIIKIIQTPSMPSSVDFFEMPVPIKVIGTNGETAYLRLDHTTNNQIFINQINFPILTIQFNYENQILAKSSVVKDNSLAVEDLVSSKNLTIYPNPAKDVVHISSEGKIQEVAIYDAKGSLVKTIAAPEKDIKISDLPKGVYMLKIKTEQEETTKKLIKE